MITIDEADAKQTAIAEHNASDDVRATELTFQQNIGIRNISKS